MTHAGRTLLRLDLSDNPLTSEVADSLSSMLAQQPLLRSLNLNDTSLTDEGVSTVCQAVGRSSPNLQELELALNEITVEGAVSVAACVSVKSELRKLNLRENELEDGGAVVVCSGVRKLRSLEVLDLSENQLSRVGGVGAAKAVATNPNLHLLALDGNQISEQGVDHIKAVLVEAFGTSDVLGPMDENDADVESGDENDETAYVEDEESLANLLGNMGLNR